MSTYAQALAEAQRLAACIRAYGVAVSIELQQGVSTSGWLGGHKYGVLAHHTVSSRAQGNTPCLALVKRGRADVPGPLANGYGGFDEVYRILTMGWANHPGLGGPLTLAGVTIPQNNGRPYLWGTEFEGGLNLADFTPSYRSFMARAHLGVLDYLGRPIEAHGEHLTWAPGRKIDRLDYTTASGRAELYAAKAAHEAAQAAGNEEDDMPSGQIIRHPNGSIAYVDGPTFTPLTSQHEAETLFARGQVSDGGGPWRSYQLADAVQWDAYAAIAARHTAQVAQATKALVGSVDVDEQAVAAALVGPLAAALPPHMGVVEVSDASVGRIAEGTADTLSTRLAQ